MQYPFCVLGLSLQLRFGQRGEYLFKVGDESILDMGSLSGLCLLSPHQAFEILLSRTGIKEAVD